MTASRCKSAVLAATFVALTSSVSTLALAQDATRTMANNSSVLIDGRTLTVTPGTAKGDISAQVKDLGAREIGTGAIIFRAGDKLYIIDSAPMPRGVMAMYDPDIERQRPYGLRDLDYERQRPQGLTDLDVRRYNPQGLRDLDYERQRPQGLTDLDVRRYNPQGLTDVDVERQRPRGLTDTDIERRRVYINDPDYAYYRLKKTFDEIWGSADKK